MRVDETIVGEVAVLSLKGEMLDEEDDFKLQQKIRSLVVDGVHKVIIDMAKVNRVNSRGLSSFISAAQAMRKNNGDIRLANVDRQVSHILIETRLIHWFPTFESVGRAMASYS